ncbi:hypothetical protein E2C01_039313 [Portunus trituberculatus]|uniref:Uncharacterized protein n=1 Tax=Portunus trituberculatus TaxID=210409 RepID=A0A5B7FL16_PORTR|nr:hypothetical protein [Portunus trituberculatus]
MEMTCILSSFQPRRRSPLCPYHRQVFLHKNRIFSCRPPSTLPDLTVGGTVIPLSSQYRYLGAPVRISAALPVPRQRRLHPLQWLTNNSSGISIPVAKTIYITFIRSVIDYLSPVLIQLPRAALEPLYIFQKRAMSHSWMPCVY